MAWRYCACTCVTMACPRAERPSGVRGRGLDRHLRADLDHTAGRDLEEVGVFCRCLGQADEQHVLPNRHGGANGRGLIPKRRRKKNDVAIRSSAKPCLRSRASARGMFGVSM